MPIQKFTNAEALLAGLRPQVSTEDNDLNINIQAEHEGDNEDGETGFETDDAPVETQTEEVAADAAADAADDVAADTSDTPEAAELDTSDAADEVEQKTEEVDDVVDAADGLESIAMSLAQLSVEGHEMTSVEGRLLTNHVNYVLRKYPKMNAEYLNMPSLEAFGIEDNLAVVSMESVMEGFKKAIRHGIALLKQIWTRLLAFFKNALASGEVIRRKAAKIYGDAKKLGPDFKVAETVRIPAGISRPGPTAGAVQELTNLLNAIGKTAYEDFKKSVLSSDGSVSEVEKAALRLNLQLESVSTKATGGFLGGFTLSKIDGGFEVKTVDGLKDRDAKGLKPAEIVEVAKKASELGAAIQEYKRGESARKAVSDQIEKALKQAESVANDQGKAAELFRKTKLALSVWNRRVSFETKILNKAIAAGNQVNNFLAASVSKGKGGKKKED